MTSGISRHDVRQQHALTRVQRSEPSLLRLSEWPQGWPHMPWQPTHTRALALLGRCVCLMGGNVASSQGCFKHGHAGWECSECTATSLRNPTCPMQRVG